MPAGMKHADDTQHVAFGPETDRMRPADQATQAGRYVMRSNAGLRPICQRIETSFYLSLIVERTLHAPLRDGLV